MNPAGKRMLSSKLSMKTLRQITKGGILTQTTPQQHSRENTHIACMHLDGLTSTQCKQEKHAASCVGWNACTAHLGTDMTTPSKDTSADTCRNVLLALHMCTHAAHCPNYCQENKHTHMHCIFILWRVETSQPTMGNLILAALLNDLSNMPFGEPTNPGVFIIVIQSGKNH